MSATRRSSLLSDVACYVFGHTAACAGFVDGKRQTDRAYFADRGHHDASSIEAAIAELVAKGLIYDFGDELKLTPDYQRFSALMADPIRSAIEMMIREQGLTLEMDADELQQLLSEWTPESWSSVLLLRNGQVVESYCDLPLPDARLKSRHWRSSDLEGRIILISKDENFPKLSAYEWLTGTDDWLPLVTPEKAVAVVPSSPRARASALAQ